MKKNHCASLLPRLLPAALLLSCLPALGQGTGSQPSPDAPPGPVFVRGKFGGFIFGYDVDRNGTEGIFSEGGAVETFDQKTGKIIKVVAKEKNPKNDFVSFGIVGNSVGLVEEEITKNGFVDKRVYHTVNPLSGNKFTGLWTPPLQKDDIISGISQSQGSPNNAILAFQNGGDFHSFVFSTDVAKNKFGNLITLTDPNFSFSHIPVVALDPKKNSAVLATQGSNPFGPPTLARVDLVKGKVSEFTGLGIGFVNGIAVDPNTGIACTTTNIDASVEFYDSRKKIGLLIEQLPNSGGNEFLSGGDVEVDPVHKLFFVEQYTSNGNVNDPQPRVYVYDEKGNLKKSIGGFTRIPISPVYIAINPATRTGFILLDDLVTLQSFNY